MSEEISHNVNIQFLSVIGVVIRGPKKLEHSGHHWASGEIVVTFSDHSKVTMPFASSHYQTAGEVPEIVVSCTETDITSKFQEMQAKLAIISETARGYDD